MGSLTITILAGGQSRRMGRDKATLRWNEESLLERTARIALDLSLPVIVVGRECPEGWPYPGVQFVQDSYPGIGPIGGLATAIKEQASDILLLSCDLPLLTIEAVNWLIKQATVLPPDSERAWQGLITVNGARIEPLFSIYHHSLLPILTQQINAKNFRLRSLIQAGEFLRVDLPPEFASALTNINTTADWNSLIGRRG